MNPRQAAVYSLIQLFVQRQTLVRDVIRKFRPKLLDPTQPWPSREYIQATSQGYWGPDNEWTYYLHGSGCRLIHTTTHERVEWNAPDLLCFDPWWLFYWSVWWLQAHASDPRTQTLLALLKIDRSLTYKNEELRRVMFDILQQLQQMGGLRPCPDYPHNYELLNSEGEP